MNKKMKLSKDKLVLKVYTPSNQSAMRQDEAPVDIHGCNAPATRRQKIFESLSNSNAQVIFNEIECREDNLDLALVAHDKGFINFLDTSWSRWEAMENHCVHFFGAKAAGSSIPSILPGNYVNKDDSQDPGNSVYSQACFYMADTEAPVYKALRPALVADMAVIQAVSEEISSTQIADSSQEERQAQTALYALITHPGHHAGFSNCSGYCYINSAAVLAQLIRKNNPDIKKIAIVDVDYHAGNGTIGIFWNDPDIFVASIHGHPDVEYPYTCGFSHQIGGPLGKGSTYCAPLYPGATWDKDYKPALVETVKRVAEHGSQYLIVSLGVDTLRNDPVAAPTCGGFAIDLEDYINIGATLRTAGLPTTFIQEGGYDLDRLGVAVANTLQGFCDPI